MYDVFYIILEPSLKSLQRHYLGTVSLVLSFSEVNFDDKNMECSNLDIPIKSNKSPT